MASVFGGSAVETSQNKGNILKQAKSIATIKYMYKKDHITKGLLEKMCIIMIYFIYCAEVVK